MSPPDFQKDLVVLCADADMQQAILGLMQRATTLGLRQISCDVVRHPGRDPGVFNGAHEFLRSYLRTHRYAVAMLDHEGSGCEHRWNAQKVAEELQQKLENNGWQQRCGAVVIAPELEAWVWGYSRAIPPILGFSCEHKEMRRVLCDRGYWAADDLKPTHPKEAFLWALRENRVSRSASLFRQIAGVVDANSCVDPAFGRFRALLEGWFRQPRS